MGLEQVLQWNVRLFMLIFARWAGMIMLAPVFGARGVPVAVRVVVTASISLILYPLIANSGPVVPGELFAYVGVLIKEILVGLVIGFVIYAVTAVLEGAGQLVDFDMGFTMGNMIDPVYGMQSPMMGNFQSLLATMILLSTDAHHYLIAAMVKSYTYVPINPNSLPVAPRFYIDLVGQIFAL
ncbi:MAG TPA: flagellar biosynthetic protein FliR, partial [Desulfobacteria bacterium]|nr:flagellar biosynthetic protein FliR [Desulfobacteria bacterium]